MLNRLALPVGLPVDYNVTSFRSFRVPTGARSRARRPRSPGTRARKEPASAPPLRRPPDPATHCRCRAGARARSPAASPRRHATTRSDAIHLRSIRVLQRSGEGCASGVAVRVSKACYRDHTWTGKLRGRYRGDPGDTGGCLSALYGRIQSACDLQGSRLSLCGPSARGQPGPSGPGPHASGVSRPSPVGGSRSQSLCGAGTESGFHL